MSLCSAFTSQGVPCCQYAAFEDEFCTHHMEPEQRARGMAAKALKQLFLNTVHRREGLIYVDDARSAALLTSDGLPLVLQRGRGPRGSKWVAAETRTASAVEDAVWCGDRVALAFVVREQQQQSPDACEVSQARYDPLDLEDDADEVWVWDASWIAQPTRENNQLVEELGELCGGYEGDLDEIDDEYPHVLACGSMFRKIEVDQARALGLCK